jgi:hypothetical protein
MQVPDFDTYRRGIMADIARREQLAEMEVKRKMARRTQMREGALKRRTAEA